MSLGTVNGVRVVSAERVPWAIGDAADVVVLCESRGLVKFDGGGSADALVFADRCIIWERTTRTFRAIPLGASSVEDELETLAARIHRAASRLSPEHSAVSMVLINLVGIINSVKAVFRVRM